MAAAVLAAALTAAAAAAQTTNPDGDLRSMPPRTPMWWDGWFPPAAPKPPAAKPAAADKAPTAGAPAAESSAAVRRRETAAFLRRQAVCDRLCEIAAQNGDDALAQRANDLEDRAWAIFQERTAGLQGGAALVDGDDAAPPKGSRGRCDGRAELMRGGKP
jgi:hypothetical protein